MKSRACLKGKGLRKLGASKEISELNFADFCYDVTLKLDGYKSYILIVEAPGSIPEM